MIWGHSEACDAGNPEAWFTRSIIEAHGGRIWATANPERGRWMCDFLSEVHAELDRAAGTGRRELEKAKVVSCGAVGVEPPPEP